MSHDVILKKSGALQTCRDGFWKNMALRSLRERISETSGALQTSGNGFRKHLALCRSAWTDFEKIWRYANFGTPETGIFRGSNGVRRAYERRSKASESEFT
jgi:hypothetical protein